jgi:hypothetical protein
MDDQLQHQPCNPHPDAPHGFNRNASHNAGRYVCDCEGWDNVDWQAIAGDQALTIALLKTELGIINDRNGQNCMKIVINRCHGGFGLSVEAEERYLELKGIKVWPEKDTRFGFVTYWTVPPEEQVTRPVDFHYMPPEYRKVYNETYREQTFDMYSIERNDPVLVQLVEELGEKASGHYADLKIVEIPEDVNWEIEEYDGLETIREVSRTWF